MKFDIFAKLAEEIDDFDTGYYIVGKPKGEMEYKGSSRKGERGGYYFSQKDTLESIDLASASKYKKGIRDEEGQRKTFINIVNFYRDVMKMKINIDVKNYIFEPTSLDYTWPVWLMDKKFKAWSDEESYDDQIDEYGHDLATYGTTLGLKLSDCTERIPLRTIRNTQAATKLYDACVNGGYFHITGDFHYNKMKGYPGWNLKDLKKNSSYCVEQRYGLVPAKMLEGSAWKENGGVMTVSDDDEMVLAQSILIPDEREKGKDARGIVLWMEKLDEKSWPIEECHAEKVDGRWLGRGEIEKQLENQIARNLTANLRRRGLLWAVKKIYQSSDEEVQRNLLMEVADGSVVKVKQNGQITQVNTGSQSLAEFTSDENNWKENSQQVAFAFNIATGENMPSGTSFSLGVVLEKAVSSHFTQVRKTFSSFLKRSFFDQLIPIFREEYSGAHTQQFPLGATDIENLKEAMVTFHLNLRIFDNVIKGKPVNPDQIRQDIVTEMARNPYLFVDIPDNHYPDMHYFMRLNIDDDISADITSLTTLYQALMQKGDPRADVILKLIFATQGKTLDALAGTPPKPAAPPAVPGQNGITPVQPINPAAAIK